MSQLDSWHQQMSVCFECQIPNGALPCAHMDLVYFGCWCVCVLYLAPSNTYVIQVMVIMMLVSQT